eukprot:653563-Rhodomonas_salina.5
MCVPRSPELRWRFGGDREDRKQRGETEDRVYKRDCRLCKQEKEGKAANGPAEHAISECCLIRKPRLLAAAGWDMLCPVLRSRSHVVYRSGGCTLKKVKCEGHVPDLPTRCHTMPSTHMAYGPVCLDACCTMLGVDIAVLT